MGLVSADDTFLTEWNASILGPQGVRQTQSLLPQQTQFFLICDLVSNPTETFLTSSAMKMDDINKTRSD